MLKLFLLQLKDKINAWLEFVYYTIPEGIDRTSKEMFEACMKDKEI